MHALTYITRRTYTVEVEGKRLAENWVARLLELLGLIHENLELSTGTIVGCLKIWCDNLVN